MKKFKFLAGVLGMMAFAACSSDEPNAPLNPGEEDAVYGDSYLSVSLMMPTSINGRAEGAADNDEDKYDKGTAEESKVNNVFFFFFDSKNNVIDIQKFEDIEFKDGNPFNPNPFVTSFGTKEVRLKSGLEYSAVAVAINSSVASASDFRNIKTLSDLQDHGHEYLSNVKTAGFVMSNSVYYDKLGEDGKSTYTTATTPTEADKIILVPITAKNIYTSAQRNSFEQLVKDGTKEYVDIFVERVLAKVEVTASLKDAYYVSNDNGETRDITLYDNVNLTTKKVRVSPVILGAALNVLTKEAKLIKPILATQVGYGVGDGVGYKNFQWNDPINKRSYWANTEEVAQANMDYFSWNEVKGKNLKSEGENQTIEFSQYIHPNTQDYLPIAENENNSSNTKVMVVAQLQAQYVDEDGNETGEKFNLDLVRYGSEYMEKSGFLAHVANYVTVAMRSESWDGFTATEKAILDVLVPNSLADKTVEEGEGENKTQTVVKVITPAMFQIGKLSDDMNGAYEAKVSKSNAFAYTFTIDAEKDADFFKYSQEEVDAMKEDEKTAAEARDFIKDPAIAEVFMSENASETLAALADKATERLLGYGEGENHVNGTVDKALSNDEINKPQILYWKDGMTYFYTTIKQQGFYGLTGANDATAPNYLNGVVRNHVYKVDITGFYGLGTPVIDPTTPIDPERPTIDRPSYLNARINVLPWRIVKNDATLH